MDEKFVTVVLAGDETVTLSITEPFDRAQGHSMFPP
jgi:hypothetical protein